MRQNKRIGAGLCSGPVGVPGSRRRRRRDNGPRGDADRSKGESEPLPALFLQNHFLLQNHYLLYSSRTTSCSIPPEPLPALFLLYHFLRYSS
ncbi:unnamed protein product [Arctogadus glacialis]